MLPADQPLMGLRPHDVVLGGIPSYALNRAPLDAALDLLGTFHANLAAPLVQGPVVTLPGAELDPLCVPSLRVTATSTGRAPDTDMAGYQPPLSGGPVPADCPSGSDETHQTSLAAAAATAAHADDNQAQGRLMGRPVRRAARQAAATIVRSQRVLSAAYSSDEEDELEEEEDSGSDTLRQVSAAGSEAAGSVGRAGRAAASANDKRKRHSGGPRGLRAKEYDNLVDPSLPPDQVRRVRRMLSNRESARRARARKEAQVAALEGELAAVRQEQDQLRDDLAQAERCARSMAEERSRLAAEVVALRAQLEAAAEGLSLSRVPSDLQVRDLRAWSLVLHRLCLGAFNLHVLGGQVAKGLFLPAQLLKQARSAHGVGDDLFLDAMGI